MGLALGRDNNITTGKVYKAVIDKERKGEYLGKTVQVHHFLQRIRSRLSITECPRCPRLAVSYSSGRSPHHWGDY